MNMDQCNECLICKSLLKAVDVLERELDSVVVSNSFPSELDHLQDFQAKVLSVAMRAGPVADRHGDLEEPYEVFERVYTERDKLEKEVSRLKTVVAAKSEIIANLQSPPGPKYYTPLLGGGFKLCGIAHRSCSEMEDENAPTPDCQRCVHRFPMEQE